MGIVIKPQWWSKLASFYTFSNDGTSAIDSDELLATLHNEVEGAFGQMTSSTFLSTMAYVIQQSANKINETGNIIPLNANGDIMLGYGGHDFLSGTAGDNIILGGLGTDFFSGSAGVDLMIGSDESQNIFERDTVAYLMATSGITINATVDTSTGGASGYQPNQDVYTFTYQDWVNPDIPKITDFELGPGGDILDISGMLQAVGYTGSNPLADNYIKLSNVTDGVKIQFDPDGNGSGAGKEFVRLLGVTLQQVQTQLQHNLLLSPLPPVVGTPNYMTYVPNDGQGSYDILFSIENFLGSRFDDVMHGHTKQGNIMYGFTGNDTIYGEGGSDKLVGGAGVDNVYGGDGMDLLLIGTGGDQVWGGNHQDIFKFDGTIGANIAVNKTDIWDFEVGSDKIDVAEILLRAGYTGTSAVADGYVQIVQSGVDTHIKIDLDGSAGAGAAQTLAVLRGVDPSQFSTLNNLTTSAQKILYVATLGQSNAEGLRVTGDDADSGLTRVASGILAQTNYDAVQSVFKDENGSVYTPAIGSTRVNGDYGGKLNDSWWFPAANKPGEILIRAIEILAVQIAEARAKGAVTPVIIWGQGEGDSVYIGGQTTETARLNAQNVYMNATLSVFDYIKAQLGSDIQFYIMETGRYSTQAALNDGTSQATADRTQNGLPYIRAAQEQMALLRSDVFIATKYTDLPLNYEYDPVGGATDAWHFHPETREIIGDRIADFMALNMGFDHVLDNPGDYPIYMLTDVNLKANPGITVHGNANHNIVVGTLGNDILAGGGGNDTLYGGAGVDEVHYTLNYASYLLTNGTYLTVQDLVSTDGTDTLMDIERIVFANGVYENGVFTPTNGGPNNPPVAQDDVFTGNQDSTIAGNVLSNNGNGIDTDADGHALSVTAGTYATAHGSVTVNVNGTFVYTPNAGYYGTDSFEYTVTDGQGGSDVGLVNLTINQFTNTAPVAQDDNFTGVLNSAITGNVLVNNGNGADSDVNGHTLTVTPGTYATANGSVTILANGNFTYTPNSGYFGADTFTYIVNDGHGGSDVGQANITINAANIVGTEANNTLTGTAGNDVMAGLGGNDTMYGEAGNDTMYGDAGNDTLKGRDGDDIMYGGDGIDYLEGGNGNDILNGGLGVDTMKGSSGIDTFAYVSLAEAGDIIQDFAVSNEKIDLSALLNNAPGFTAAQAITAGFIKLQQSGADTLLSIDLDGNAGSGTAVLLATLQNVVTSNVKLTNFILPPDTVVPPTNTAPVAQDDNFTGNQDATIAGNVLANNGNGTDSDANGHALNVVATTIATANGSVTVNADGTFVYTPNAGYYGVDSFEYTVTDGQGGSDVGLVNLTINQFTNTAPVAQDDNFTGNQDATIAGNVLADNGAGVDSDIDGHTLSINAGTYATANGSVTINANGTFVYTPNAGYFGSDSFDYTVNDGYGGSDVGLVNLTINQFTNTAPVAQDDIFTGNQDATIAGNVLANNGNGTDSDANGHALNVVATTIATANGSVTVNADGTFVYTPNAGYYGVDSFEYTVTDGHGGSDVGLVNLTINQLNLNDIFIGTSAAETFNGDIGSDTVDYSASAIGVTIDLKKNTITGGDATGDTLISIENIIGSNNATQRDTIYGDNNANTLYGMAGDDLLQGGMGADILDGGAGRDNARYKDSAAAININLETNIHTGGEAEGDKLYNIECIQGSFFDDVIRGGNGNDWLSAEKGNDIVTGGLGMDDLFGGLGADTFLFEAISAYAQADQIRDFTRAEGDKIDISDLLTMYDSNIHAITDFVRITDSGVNSILAVDADGGGNNFVTVAVIRDRVGLTDEQDLVNTGNLIV